MKFYLWALLLFFTSSLLADEPVVMSGELKKWHTIQLDFVGPETSENAQDNPFSNYRLNVTFRHKQSGQEFLVPGFFAADGNAAETSAIKGNVWRTYFTPNQIGEWEWHADFRAGQYVAIALRKNAGKSGGFMDGKTGVFNIEKSDKSFPDFRQRGRLEWVNQRYLRFAETGDYFFKGGPDSPENLLAYEDFDGDFHSDGHGDKFIKSYREHQKDWQKGDPSWQSDKGKGLIGALNYLAVKGLNSISFLTMNIKGDDKNVYPYLHYDDYTRFDVSKLAQWNIVFSHAQTRGLFLHFKTQEVENQGLLDGGGVGLERQLYYRELIARFSHHLALNWNMGEENGDWVPHNITPPQSTQQRVAMARYFAEHDPYNHHRVIHNGVFFDDLRADDSHYTGASIQTSRKDFSGVHGQVKRILDWPITNGKQWAVAVDEPGDAEFALQSDDITPDYTNARQNGLWGALMAGAWGTEWYFGYKNKHSDLTAEDWRTRDKFWDQVNIAIDFFSSLSLPIEKTKNYDNLSNDGWVLGVRGEFYIVYLKDVSASAQLKLPAEKRAYTVKWFNPREGGSTTVGKEVHVTKTGKYQWQTEQVALGSPPDSANKDWVAIVEAK